MNNEKVFSKSFKEMKEEYLWRKEIPEIIRPEDMRDEEYIQKLAPFLPKFEKVRDGVYKFRCLFCGDSKTNPNKRRGYFYLKGYSYNYCCQNCNHRSSLKTVLQELKPELYMEYMQGEISDRERFRDVNNQRRMDKIYEYVYGGLTSFEDMKKHSGKRFKEITKRLREEDKKRRKKRTTKGNGCKG